MKLNQDVTLELSGTYEVKVIRNGKVIKHIPPFKNLITDVGLNLWMTNPLVFTNKVHIGTGTNPAAFTDTAIQTRVAFADRATAFLDFTPSAPWYTTLTANYTFTPGSVNATITEMGVNYQDTNANMFSRVLLPTPLVVTPEDSLSITYRFYLKFPTDDVVSTVSDGTTDYTVTRRLGSFKNNPIAGWNYLQLGAVGFNTPANAFFYARESDVLLAPTVDSYGTYDGTSGVNGTQSEQVVLGAYTAGSFTRTWSFRFSAGRGNFPTGIGTAQSPLYCGFGLWQFKFSPKLPKDATKVMVLGFRLTAARGTPP